MYICAYVNIYVNIAGGAAARGSYKCSRCGQPKKGHKCSLTPRGMLSPRGGGGGGGGGGGDTLQAYLSEK